MRRSSRRSSLCLFALCAAFSSSLIAQTPCVNWDVHKLSFEQGNNRSVAVAFNKKGQDITGSAIQTFMPKPTSILQKLGMEGSDPAFLNGDVDGVITGSKLKFKVVWRDGSMGIYDLQIDEHGQISGMTYDFHRQSSRADIVGFDRVPCGDPPPPPPPPPPVHRLGKRPISGAATPAPVPLDIQRAQTELPKPAEQRRTAITCASGFVWREVNSSDHVCVTPDSRTRVARENATAAEKWVDGMSGPRTCVSGFVWREAAVGDQVCVPPAIRDAVREENRLGPSRVAQ